jgi:hypothetical protein
VNVVQSPQQGLELFPPDRVLLLAAVLALGRHEQFLILFQQLDPHAVVHLFPRLVEQLCTTPLFQSRSALATQHRRKPAAEKIFGRETAKDGLTPFNIHNDRIAPALLIVQRVLHA